MSRRITLSEIEITVLEKLVTDKVAEGTRWVDYVIASDFKEKLLLKLAAPSPNTEQKDKK